MATTLTTLLAATRRFLDETTAGTWSDADLTQYINDSQMQLWLDMCETDPSFGLRESIATMGSGVSDYLYPDDILGRNVASIYVYGTGTGVPWKKVSAASYDEVAEEGTILSDSPNVYCCMDGFFKIGPPGGTSGNTLRIAYTRKPTTLSSGSEEMDSDDCFAEAIAIGAAIRALERTGVDISPLEKRQAKAIQAALGATQPNEPRYAKQMWHYK
jgi:hypothetical protein